MECEFRESSLIRLAPLPTYSEISHMTSPHPFASDIDIIFFTQF